ncbi:MAG: HD domain-containing phosphohydrolase [Nitrospirota bacterium]
MTVPDLHTRLCLVIAQLTSAVTNMALYSPGHPQVAQFLDKAFSVIKDILATQPEVTILLVGEDLVGANRPLPNSFFISQFAKIMKKKSFERLSFFPNVTRPELEKLIRDLASVQVDTLQSSPGIKLGKIELRVKTADSPETGEATNGKPGTGTSASPEIIQELLALTQTELDGLKEFYLSAKKHRQIDVRGLDDMVKGFIKGFRQEINPLSLLASLKSVNEYTFTHATNVCILTMSQAENMGFTGEHLHAMGIASLLHDIGKIFVPESILTKPGILTNEERKIMESHTVKGARYLMGLEGIPKLAVLAALEHHKKFDGSGYPSIKAGWTPNVTSQLITIADVFDAMRTRRSYQEPVAPEKIEAYFRKGSGTIFNPVFVERFLKMIKR